MKAIIGAHVVKSFIVYTIFVLKDLKVAKLEEPLHLIQRDNFSHQGPNLRERGERGHLKVFAVVSCSEYQPMKAAASVTAER